MKQEHETNPYNERRDRRDVDNNPVMALANSALVIALSRVSMPILVALTSWILITVMDLHTAQALANATLVNHESRLGQLEQAVFHIPGNTR